MNRTCIRMHDGKYPQDVVVAFCTKVGCDKRYSCGRCYHEYHADHLAQLIPINELPKFVNKVNHQIQKEHSNELMDLLLLAKKQFIEIIEEKCMNLQQNVIDAGGDITEELLNQILNGDQNSENRMKSLRDFLEDLQYIQRALKLNIRIQKNVMIVEDKLFDGFTYSGELVNDLQHGTGKAVYKNGNIYIGDWKLGVKCGKGILQLKNGSEYKGEFQNNKHNGMGLFKFANQDTYEGEWKDDNIHGLGIYKFSIGNSYNGQFKDNIQEGRGLFTWKNGDVYDGDWVDGNRTGLGKFIFKNGNIEIGRWCNDLKQGDHEFFELKKTIIITYKDSKELFRRVL